MSSRSFRDESPDLGMRLYVVQYLVLAIFIALGIRFYFLQVVRHDAYTARAEENRIREIPIIATRGSIFDRNGQRLVDSTPAWNIVVTPEDIPKENRQETINALVEQLGVDYKLLMTELEDPHRPKSQPILIKQNATKADQAWVAARELEYPEIRVEDQPQRIYPHGKLAAHVLGYIGEISPKMLEDPRYADAGYKSGDIIGLGGIEAQYDLILRGQNGKRLLVVDSRGRQIRELTRVEPIKGMDIITTLDIDVQRVAEDQFDSVGQTGVAVAMNPQNGEILAMVSRPAFDPNVFAENVISSGENRAEVRAIMNDVTHPLYNKAIQGRYPTGSTWKLMMTTAALEEGVITPKDSRLVCGHGIQMGNKFVACMGNHGSPDIHAAIVHSCDGYFYRLGLKMGIDKIHDWVVRFGAGAKTGIDLPHELKGIIPDREWKKRVNPRDPVWKDFDTVLAAVGQGSVAITPLQLLRAESGIMMGGEFHTPHLLKEARETQLFKVKTYEDSTVNLVLSPTTVDIVSYGAWGVVNEGGTGGRAALPGINVGGKTGTAQVIAKEKVRTKEHQDHGWFISFAPLHTSEKPEFAAVVLTEHGGQGGLTSAPKSRMINAEYFSKKLGHRILPELAAKPDPGKLSQAPKTPAPNPGRAVARVEQGRRR
ncbi:MAG TPA: penicillin-binding protein 2 [Blastocatellia bacterium]|nr:penicillin-binding protein 2 [Blastocatellia bacterium]